MVKRRKMLIGLGALAAGGAAATGTGAFTTAETDSRVVDANIVDDDKGYLGLQSTDDPNSQYFELVDIGDFGKKEAEIKFDESGNGGAGVNYQSQMTFESVFKIVNQGTQEVEISLESTNPGNVKIQSQSDSISAPGNSAIVVSLDDDADDSVVPAGEAIDVDFLVDVGTTGNIRGGIKIKAEATS